MGAGSPEKIGMAVAGSRVAGTARRAPALLQARLHVGVFNMGRGALKRAPLGLNRDPYF